MIDAMHSVERPMNQNVAEKSLDPQLWHACAGGMAQIPPPNSKVYYFPQGHAERTNANIDLDKFPRISALVPCRVSSINYLADAETDEVYAKIRLVPLFENMPDAAHCENGIFGFDKNLEYHRANSFAKTLTQSDANNGGGFSVPRYCAETIFPRLDYSAEPPVQTILARDPHGQVWRFRHIYRGTPRRHLLTTGWSSFVNRKRLVVGDSVVFVRAESGELCIGLRRAKRVGPEVVLTGWNTGSAQAHLDGSRVGECVIEAMSLAAAGLAFEVVYHPRAGSLEFVVGQSRVRAAMGVRWGAGMRFKMAFETEDSSRISWFMGTVSSVEVEDSVRWPQSPWRLLKVAWDEPDLLQNVKRVSPWVVELVSNVPPGFVPPISPPPKRARVPQPSDYPLGQPNIPSLFANPLSSITPLRCFDHASAGVQGARHARSGPSDLQLQPFDFELLSYEGPPKLVLFGQAILTEEQISRSCSVDTEENNFSDCSNQANTTYGSNGLGSGGAVVLEMGHCKVFAESDDVGRTLDLSALGSYDEMHRRLGAMFGMGSLEVSSSNVLHSDASGTTKHVGGEFFGDFIKKARRITILAQESK